jgi:competence protein ComGC
MPLINCPDCGKEVSSQANACPNCAHPLNLRQSGATNHAIRKTVFTSVVVSIAVVACLVFLMIIYIYQSKQAVRRTRENAAIQQLESLRKVEADYALQTKGLYGSFSQLRSSGSLDDDRFAAEEPQVDGYKYTLKIMQKGQKQAAFYTINADPIDDPNGKHFYLDPDIAALRVNETQPAISTDPPLTK